ncbi:MAG: hypothetical protein PHC50_04510 [Candidatus Cloacimonetes bacterium]|nr:hypothetical protein [Candidatus Cloacimonadota bacterium]
MKAPDTVAFDYQLTLDVSNMLSIAELVVNTMMETQIKAMLSTEKRKDWMRLCVQFKQDLERLGENCVEIEIPVKAETGKLAE